MVSISCKRLGLPHYYTEWFDQFFRLDNTDTWKAYALRSSSVMFNVQTWLNTIFSFIVLCFLLSKTAFLFFLFNLFWFLLPCFSFSVSIAMWLGASTPSRSGGLRYVPFGLDFYFHNYKNFLDTERFDALLSSVEWWSFYNARNGLDRHTSLGAWVCHWTLWVSATLSCRAMKFDMSTYLLCVVNNNAGMRRSWPPLLISFTHSWVIIFRLLVCITSAEFRPLTRYTSLIICDTEPTK